MKRLPIESHSSKSCKNWSKCHHSSIGHEKKATCQHVYLQIDSKDQQDVKRSQGVYEMYFSMHGDNHLYILHFSLLPQFTKWDMFLEH